MKTVWFMKYATQAANGIKWSEKKRTSDKGVLVGWCRACVNGGVPFAVKRVDSKEHTLEDTKEKIVRYSKRRNRGKRKNERKI